MAYACSQGVMQQIRRGVLSLLLGQVSLCLTLFMQLLCSTPDSCTGPWELLLMSCCFLLAPYALGGFDFAFIIVCSDFAQFFPFEKAFCKKKIYSALIRFITRCYYS